MEWTVGDDRYALLLGGLIPPPVAHTGGPGDYDLIIFDSTNCGESADEARCSTPVIGDSEFADRLEDDRKFGIEVMEAANIKVPQWREFTDTGEATEWLKKTRARAVFKPYGDVAASLTYVSKSADDMIRYLERLEDKNKGEFVLQEYVQGTEISTEGFFNGKEWVLIDHTLEEKKFLSGGLGPNTGCAGSVVWMPPYATPVFEQGLKRVADILRQYNYVGPIDLNTIVTEGELYGIEWTPRFGYEATCNLTRLLPTPFGDFLGRVSRGENVTVGASRYSFSATIRISIPPYPTDLEEDQGEGTPIFGIDLDKLQTFYLHDVHLDEHDELVSGGTSGFIGAPIGVGSTIEQAFEECEVAIKGLQVPDLQWRNDLSKSIMKRYDKLMTGGWLKRKGDINA